MGGELMEIIKIIIAALTFALGWHIWKKAVDRADEFLRKRVSERIYEIIIWSIIIVTYVALFYALFK